MGESVDHFVSAGFLRGYLYAFFVLQFIQVPEADVFSSRQLIPDEIWKMTEIRERRLSRR